MKSNYRQGRYSSGMAMLLTMLAVVVIFAGAAVPAHAQTPTTMHSFLDGSFDACEPEDNIVQGRDGNMYGIGVSCGTASGAVYKISPAGVESVLFNFPSGWSSCFSGLTIGSDGNFYGTCFTTPSGNGSIFQLTPAGVFTDKHDFTGTNGDTEPEYAPIQATDGNFYGVTGDYPFTCGNVYKLTSAGVYTSLHTFSGSDCGPASSLFQASDGNLYGTLYACAINSGIGNGCVYKISTAGVFKEIFGFSSSTGEQPCTGVIQAKNGNLYGATQSGAANNFGSIYKLTTAGVFTDLHDFNNSTDASCGDNIGRTNVNLTQVTDGAFYGVNGINGTSGEGSIYKLTSTNVFTDFLFPNPPVDGGSPLATLLQNTNGLLYGTTPSGGPASCNPCLGVFFSVATGDAAFVNLEPTQKTALVGAKVGMFGQGFSSATAVKFGGVASTKVTLSGTTYLTATVPVGALTGAVTVTTGSTTLTSAQTFKVKPKVTSFSPPSGPIGTLVTINGSGLIQATSVKFGTVKATTFTVVSDSEVTADVPSGLANGAVTISITTPGGTANSATKFTVN
jgi:uncharacterized repeat protein (TIGR03803 family)